MTKTQSLLLLGMFVAAGLSPFIPLPTFVHPVIADSAAKTPAGAAAATAPAADAANAADAVDLDPSTNKPRTPHPAPAAGATITMAIKQLGNFAYDPEKGGIIPADVLALAGHNFITTGYMIPLDEVTNITQFALVPSLTSCCFGQPPGIQHVILVKVPKNQSLKYTQAPVRVTGTLRVQEKREDGYTTDLFEIDASNVQPLPDTAFMP